MHYRMCHQRSILFHYAIFVVTFLFLFNNVHLTLGKKVARDQHRSSSQVSSSGNSRSVDMRVEFEVEEGVSVGTFVGKIPTKPGFTYRFNEQLEYFMINGTSGEVRTRKEIDRESLQNDQFDIVVLSSQPTYPIEVRILIKDINDCSPAFPEPTVAVTFPESAISGTRVFLDPAEDEDSPSNGVHTGYKIVDGNEEGHFRLVVTTNPSGEAPFLHLETTGKLDRETKPSYQLNISAQDDGINPRFGFLVVNVSINDVNDCQPIFIQGQYYASLNESVEVGTSVLQVLAADNDEGENARISYYISETEEQFSIEPETGIIRTAVAGVLNCPKNCAQGAKSCPKSCVFTVFARDHGTPRQDGRAYVTVTLVESNHPPIIKFRYFPPTASTANVLESAPNASVVAAISVIDMDEGPNGDTIVEIVQGNELKNFILESTASFQLVRTNGMLDREKIPFYNLTITARDNGLPPCSSTAFLIIEVNNDQDPEISFAKTEYSAILRESVPIGSYVASITATGETTRHKSQVIYSIVSGNEKQWFSIDQRSGLLTTRSHLDRETQDTVRLKISARDGGPYPKWAHAQIKITILDENDETPKFSNEMIEVSLSEDVPPGTEVATVSALDHDQGTNGTITFSLSPYTELSYPNQFQIDPSFGKIITKAKLDRESVSVYDIYVVAKDHGSPALSSTAVVHLELKDVNDNAPAFYPLEYFFIIGGGQEGLTGGSVGQVIATDPDSGINGKVNYKLTSAPSSIFGVEPKTGNIILKSSLPQNSRSSSFQLQVSAMDGGGKVSENDAMVNILIHHQGRGESNNKPHFQFSQPSYTFSVVEDFGLKFGNTRREIGQVKVKVSATGGDNKNNDGKDATNNNVKYTITNGDPNGIFTIDQKTGKILAIKLLDRESQSNHTLSIFAQIQNNGANNNNNLYGFTTVSITVTDLNDQMPTWDYSLLDVSIYKNAPIGQEIVVLAATDKDSGINSKLAYNLVTNPQNLFSIDSSNGLITLQKPLRDIISISDVVVEIRATDSGEVPLSSSRNLLIHLKEINQHSPVFDHFSYETSLLESTPVNTRFFTLKATDKDVGLNAELSYEIIDGNFLEKFGIFPDGHLFVKSHLDREMQDYFSLSIQVKDNGSPSRFSITTFVIHVIDENDVAPKFINSTFSFSIPENEPAESYVGKVVALDGDMGRNAELTYHFTTPQLDFSIDAKNGFIKTLRPFDREQLVQALGGGVTSISLEVVVEDNGATKLSDKSHVVVKITDVNDEIPKFSRENYNIQISEDSPIGASVVRVMAVDSDEGLNGEIFYSIVKGNEKDKFQIDGATGHVSLRSMLDREIQDRYTLSVMAQDMAETSSLRSYANVSVTVLDANDNAPVVSLNESYLISDHHHHHSSLLHNNKLEIVETTSINTELIKFNATDADLGQNGQLAFSLSGGNRHDTFRINGKTGILYLNKQLDYEKYNKYTLTITVTDFGSPKLSSSMELGIEVLDFNDCAPQFPTTSIVRQIQEGISLKSPIVTVTAEDADSGDNGRIRYSIKHQSPAGNHFGIDPSTGTIHTLLPIDREFADTFRLTIVAQDQATPANLRLSSEKLVTVIVEDVNDCEPKFTCLNAALLRANSEAMTEIMVISATDLDSDSNGVVTYDLLSGDTNLFELNRITGLLQLRRGVTTVQPRYQLTIRATDEAIQSQRKYSDLLLMVLGVSEGSGSNGLRFEKETYQGSISENEALGSSILSVTATTQGSILDSESGGANVEYYITNITSPNGVLQNRLFDIDVKRGILSTAAILDREMGVWNFHIEIYAVLVSARGLYTASTQVKVSVLDKNDSPPVWPQSEGFELSISENAPVGQEITTLHATDEDLTGKVSYSIVGNGGEGKFMLDSKTGVLKIIDTLDREIQDKWILTVRANDEEQFSDTTVTITVTDTNDNPPSWENSAYSFDIEEGSPPGQIVGILSAVDLDEGVNGRVTYSILSGWGDDMFSLHPNSGVVTLTGKLDYENVQHYIFVVQAQDTGIPSLSSTTTVYLNVLDLNDNSPVFEPISYSIEVPETIPVGSSIITVSASDMDSGDNGKIHYTITNGNVDDAFSVFQNGTICTVKELDRETMANYQLTIQAKDQAELNPLSSSVQVTITLKDVNDAPEFVSADSISVIENTPINSVLVVVKAIDKDEGRNGYVEYTLHNEKSIFSLGAVDGLLRVIGNIDREHASNYTLNITARDRGDPPQSTIQKLFIKINDKNDHGPKFDTHQYSASVPENSSIGTNVLQVNAFDMDEGLNSQIRYSIIAGDPNRDFSIGDDSGILRVARGLNYERKRVYSLTIQAEDLGEESPYDTAIVSITILDINDRAPIFLDSPYIAYVRENMETLPQTVIVVNAHDADSLSKNFQVRYLMKDGDKDAFRVNASTGEITVHRALDRERQSEYQLTIVAMDTGTPRLTGTGMVQVLVSDENDCDPIFEHDHYELRVTENTPAGTLVSRVQASDKDDGQNAIIRYKIQSVASVPFEVNEVTGDILSKGDLDRELEEQYRFNIVATDSSKIFQRSSTAEVLINLMDENDNFPKFKQGSYSVTIPNNVASGSYVFGVTATDSDAGVNGEIRYFLGGPDSDKFQLNETTGVIKTIPALLKSGKNNFMVEVRAVDSSPKEPLSSSASIKITLASPDKFPKIRSARQEFSFLENVSNAVVTTVESSPSSKDHKLHRFQYFIGGGNLGNAFVVDRRSGQLRISPSGLDYEMAQHYELWVEVSDEEQPEFRSALPIYVSVKDVNDNSPIFDRKHYNVSIPEEEAGPKLVTTVVAIDKDSGVNGVVRYHLSSESFKKYSKIFEVKQETGEIYSKTKLDREEHSAYVLKIEAVDLGDPPRTGTATVTINVEDINDNPMKFTRLFSVNVTENAPRGTFVIQVTSVDKDVGENANCSYSFTDNSSGKFKIDSYSGNVTVAGALDREIQDEYLLKVSAKDGSWRAETLLTITIEDVNDMAPEFESSFYSFNIPESGNSVSFVGQVSAIDRDKRGPNSLVSYALKHQSDIFSVDPVSGEIFTKKTIKYKHPSKRFSPENEHDLVITAVDSGKPPMSSEVLVSINVVNVNNHAPKFSKTNYFSPILFDMPIGSKVLQLQATDDGTDFGLNAEIEYLKIGGNGSEVVDIDKTSGWIMLTGDVSRFLSKSFLVHARAIDKGIPPLADDVTIVLSVTGPNVHPPVFSSPSYRVIIPENELLESVIVTLSASDKDVVGPNGQILYNISSGNEEGKFAINPTSGAVSIFKNLDYDTKMEYILKISAMDRGYKSLSTDAELTVILTDINDNPPYFLEKVYYAAVKENAPLRTKVFTLAAKDKDSPKNAIIRYAIVGGSGKHAFSVDPVSGIIISTQIFNFEDTTEYALDIMTTNPDSNMHGTCKVVVRVEGVNEYVPRFLEPVFHFSVSESASIGSVVGSIQATDEDSGDDGIVYYILVGSSNDRGFLVNPLTGEITVSRRLDRESQSRVVLSALAKNKGSIRGNDTDEAQIVINVQDGNDPPVFEKDHYIAEIKEDAPVGSSVLTVVAFDIDVRPSNNRFTYEILSEVYNKTFRIDHITGVISTVEPLDREIIPSYTLVVGAIDTGTPPAVGKSTVTVNLIDINDNAPNLKDSSRVGEILENEPANTRVMTLQAVDADVSPNGEPFKFTLLSGKDASKFRVDSITGILYSTSSFDREINPEFTVSVEISDNGKPMALKNRQDVKIKVGDKNDNPSQSRNAEVLIFLRRNKIPHMEKVASVKPLDPDMVGQYTCRLQSGNDVFSIQRHCDLLLQKYPSSKRQSITIVADDGLHAEVVSTMQTEFLFIQDSTVKNSVIIRANGVQPKYLVEKSYRRFVSWLNSMFQGNPLVYSLMLSENGTNIVLAVPSSPNNNHNGQDQQQHLSATEIVTSLSSRIREIENILGTSVIINYSPCSTEAVCQNGGTCSHSLNLTPEQVSVDSPHLILSSPKLDLELSCQCSSEFTGVNCQHRKEPCSPNPCQDGICIRQGYDFTCVCPPHKQGKYCQEEKSNVCKVNPCLNGGTCKENQQSGGLGYFCLCRPGFLGDLCQTASNVCKPNPCLNGGECSSPIGGASAFPKCKCRAHYFGRYCEKSAFGFGAGSFMTFSSLDPNTNDIAITFSTNRKNSLLAYDFGEQTGGRSDFVALQLIKGKPTLSYGGARTEISTISVDKFVTDGQWYRIIATRNSRVVSLYVSLCQQGGEVCEECKPGNPSCYASGQGKSGTLNFNSLPLLIGGVKDIESVLERPGQIQTDDFVGCIHSIAINGRFLNMSTPLEDRGISEECHREENVCGYSSNKCGVGQCIDLWDSNVCNCNGIIASNCQESFLPFSFSSGSYVEYKVGEKYKRSQIQPHQRTKSTSQGRKSRREIPTSKSVALSFRTIQMDGVLFYAGSDQDYTLVELDQGGLQLSSRLGSNRPIRMKTPGIFVSDGIWHTFKLISQNRGLQLFLDDQPIGEELDAASAHDFLDPYLTDLALGGTLDSTPTNTIYNGFTGCMTNFTINNENQPMNGTGGIFDYIIAHGKLTRGCNSAIAGAATAPDPLSIGVTLVIVFFVFLLVGILGSVIVFRMRKREKNPLPNSKLVTKPSPGGGVGGGIGPNNINPGDRSHMLDEESEALRNFVRNSKKMVANNTCYQKPDIIERTSSNPQMVSSNNSPLNSTMLNSGHLEISHEPEIPDLPEHYDLENASSIAPSDIDIVYHYKGFRDNLGRKSSPFRHHNHHFSGNNRPGGGGGGGHIRQSPISSVLKSTPLARLSPSSELSQQITPRILTLQDISGKPLQSALLATTQKDAMSQSERSLNISRSSTRSSIVTPLNASSHGPKKKKHRKQCGGGGSGDPGSTMNIGLTAEEIERLNNSRHKNNSSLVSTLDDLSSEESEDHRKNNLSNLLERKSERRQQQQQQQQQQRRRSRSRSRDTSSEDEDESGNDSFSCSEFDYDNDKGGGGFHHHHHPHSHLMGYSSSPKHHHGGGGGGNNDGDRGGVDGGGSFHGSLSTLVASDDDLAYINNFAKSNAAHHPHHQHLPPGPGSSSMRWDYLLNWGPNFDNLSGVFKDIAQLPPGGNELRILPDVTSSPPISQDIPGGHSNPHAPSIINNFGNSGPSMLSRSSRRPSEEYI